jgi:hypothetical protein
VSVIGFVRDYLSEYSGLVSGAPVWVEFLGVDPVQYSVEPLAGTKIVEKYLNGSSLREFPFAFKSVESTADDLARLENNGFYEAFSDWLEAQTEKDDLPTLGTKQKSTEIMALGWGFLYEEGVSDRGVYQISCKLVYEQSS